MVISSTTQHPFVPYYHPDLTPTMPGKTPDPRPPANLLPRAGAQREINSEKDLTDDERITITRMIEKAVRVTKPTADATEPIIKAVFALVFTPQWMSRWPPTPPVEKERRLEDTSIQIGVWAKNLPTPGTSGNNEDAAVDDSEVNHGTPRKRARTVRAAPSTSPDRKAGAPAMIRPRLRECGLFDVWFHDRRGRRAPEDYVKYWGGETELSGDMIARAVCHYDYNEIERVNAYNRSLLVFFARSYIYGRATGQAIDEDEGPEKYYKYTKLVLIGEGAADDVRSLEPIPGNRPEPGR